MEQEQNKLKLFVTTSILTVMGMFNLLMVLFFCYGETKDTAVAVKVIFSIVMSIIFSALFVYIKRKWIVWLAYAAVLGLVFWIAREALIGGTATYINCVINEIAIYFETEMYFIEIPRKLAREANELLAIYVLLTAFAAIYGFGISNKKITILPFVISLAFTVLAMVIESGTPVKYIYGMAYCVGLAIVIIAVWNKSFGVKNLFYVQLAAIGLGCLLLVVSLIVSAVKPERKYQKPEYFNNVYEQGENVYNQFMEGELTINRVIDFLSELLPIDGPQMNFGSASGMASEIGAGELGKVDSLQFSGQEVLQVTMPNVDGKVYIKGYIGGVYSSDRWYEPEWEEENRQLADLGIYSQSLAYDNLYSLAEIGGIDGYKSYMTINYTASNIKYLFVPLYADSAGQLAYDGDGGYRMIESPYTVPFLHVDETSLSSIDEYVYTIEGSNARHKEEQYRDIAYENYLDVNTTGAMAQALAEEWSGRDISSAAARYKVACDIRKYLADTCSYTTSPGKVPSDEDFVEYFLTKSHEGYCTYFATAAVMMLRSAGIPARYVEGYFFRTTGSTETNEYSTYTEYRTDYGHGIEYSEKAVTVSVLDSSAHAWVEYYVDGVGWIDFEVTPGNYTQSAEPVTEEPATEESTTVDSTVETSTADKESTTSEKESNTSVSKTTAYNGGSTTGNNKTSFRIKLSKTAERVLIMIVLSVVIISVAVSIIVMRYKKMVIIRDRMYNGEDENLFPKSIVMIYDEYIRMLKHFGYRRRADMSENAFAEILSAECPFTSEYETRKMAELYEKAVFSKENIFKEDRDMAVKVICSVRERMYGHMGAVKRLVYKYVINA